MSTEKFIRDLERDLDIELGADVKAKITEAIEVRGMLKRDIIETLEEVAQALPIETIS